MVGMRYSVLFCFHLFLKRYCVTKNSNTAFNNKKHASKKLLGFLACKIQFIKENVKHSQDERVKDVINK